jgi:uncharacterized protein (TIGR02466 family)
MNRSMKKETDADLHLIDSPAIPMMRWAILQADSLVNELTGGPSDLARLPRIQNAWASIYRAGDYHAPHMHPMAALSGVYCIEMPDRSAPEGMLDFLDPRPRLNYFLSTPALFGADVVSIRLRPGELVLFPGWLQHFVHPFRAGGLRVTISMNFGLGMV